MDVCMPDGAAAGAQHHSESLQERRTTGPEDSQEQSSAGSKQASEGCTLTEWSTGELHS